MANLGANCAPDTASFAGVLSSTRCEAAPGVNKAYYSPISGLNLTTMSIVPTNFVVTNCGKIVNFIMQSGEVFLPIENDGFSTTYTRAKQGRKYVHTMTFEYIGLSCDRDCQLKQLTSLLCGGVILLELNDCTNILLGLNAAIVGSTVTLSQDPNKFVVTQDDIDVKTVDSDENASQIFTVTLTTPNKGICVTATSVAT